MLFDIDFHGTPPTPFKRGKKGIYYTVQRIGGKQVWRSLRTTDRKTAEYLAMEKWRAMQTEAAKSIIPVPPIPFAMLWERYIQTENYDLLEESTRTTRRRAYEAFSKFCIEKHNVYSAKEVTPDIVKEFCDKAGKAHYFNNLLCDVSAVLSCFDGNNPCERVKRRITSRGAKASEAYAELSRHQIARILSTIRNSNLKAKREWFDACIVALNTGARYKDIATLQYGDLRTDDNGSYLVFAPDKTKKKTHNRVVYIRCNAVLESLLLRRKRIYGGDYVFPKLSANVHRSTTALTTILKENNVEGSFHCFRVCVISAAARIGIDLKDFGGVVGHSSLAQTNAYNRAALNIDLSSIQKGLKISK